MMVEPAAPRGARADDLERYRPALVQYFRRKSEDRAEVDDLVQEVFLRIAARREGEVVENMSGYVFQTASSVSADRHRRRSVRHSDAHVEFDGDRHGGADFDTARILEARQSLRIAMAALEALPERTRIIFIMRRIDGHAYADIARRFGITVSGVQKHVVRAVAALVAACGSST